MRKNIFIIIVTSAIIALIGIVSDTYAGCGGSWFSSNCPVSPYCIGDSCSIQKGTEAVTKAVNGQITTKSITEYAQQIVTYFMSFISIIAVLYIIYGGFQLMTGAGDEEKMKKTRQIILYVFLGIVIMWLAYPIVKWTINLVSPTGRTALEWSIVPGAEAAYTESDNDTFAEYKNKIKEAITQMESEFTLNKTVNIATIQNVKNLIQSGYDRLPDYGESGPINKEAKQIVDTYLELAIKNPSNTNHIGNAIARASSFLDKANISRITGDINAGPIEGNAPLSVSFRAENIKDPSGTTPSDSNYVWWTRENGGYRRELGRGPSLSYTFTKEGTYTIFLDVVSGSRNSKGRIDVLPLSVSKQITVKPRLGEIILLINGVNVSNMKQLKISPTIGNMGVILDATASRAVGNGTIAETRWEFGNGNESVNPGGPIVERQIYANQGGYILKLSMKTNDGVTFTKEIQLLVKDPAAVIKLDKETGNIGEDITMAATTYFSDTKNVEYSWKIQDESGNKIIKSGEGMSFKHKFENVGSYIVSLTTKSPNGSIDTDSKVITIESRPPVVAIDTPRALAGERPNTLLFDASKSYDPDTSSKKNLSYIWKIDGEKVSLDNTEQDGAKGTYTFSEKGNHTVSLTVANIYGKITTVEKQFEVNSTLSINLITTPKVVVRGSSITMIGQSPNAEYFEWNAGDGTAVVSGTNRTFQHTYKQSGIYNVTLTVNRNGGSETNSITRKIYVSDADTPFAVIDASNSSNTIIEEKGACNGMDAFIVSRSDTTTLSAVNSINIDGTPSGLSYTWKYLGKAKTSQQVSEKFNELGCFPIELTVRSLKNGATHTATQYIKLTNNPPELTNITNVIDTAKKDSQKILVKVRANGATDPDGVITSYIWYYTTESDSEPQNVQITTKNEITFVLPNITEKYYFGVILEDNDGAKMNSMDAGTSQSPLVIDNSNGNIYLPLISLSTPKTNLNVGETARFSADVKTIIPGVNITNKVEYAWDFDGDGRIDEKSSSPWIEHVYARSGDYNLKLRVTYNGVSNTKFQSIHVRNKLKASVQGYKLGDGSVYFINTSEGSYLSTKWQFGTKTSESPIAFRLNADELNGSGTMTVSSDNNEESSTGLDIQSVSEISGSGFIYQSFPKMSNDIITVKNPTDSLIISLLGNNADTYIIDTDALVDGDLDGIMDNDADNKNDPSYTDGSAFAISNLGENGKREHKIQLSLIKNANKIETKTITVVLDYISDTQGSLTELSDGNTAGLSTTDRTRLENLSKMIRELSDGDRIILMQKYNILVENWNNTFDKAKSLIDIQEAVDSATIDASVKAKFTTLIDELLIGDAQVTDEIGIAVHLIKDLIPNESPNQKTLLEKLAEIESHPTQLELNKKLGKEMLVLIETDSTIPDKYKVHIKNQLSIIVNGGSENVGTQTGSTASGSTEATTGTGILGFISGFVKVFFIIFGIIILVGIIAFVLYRMSRKSDNMGFQDFLIDAVFHNNHGNASTNEKIETGAGNTKNEVSPIINKIEEDPLKAYIPPTPVPEVQTGEINQVTVPLQDNPLITTKEEALPPLSENTSINTEVSNPLPIGEESNIPDWLKVPEAITAETTIENGEDNKEEIGASLMQETETKKEDEIKLDQEEKGEHSDIPDWITQSTTVNTETTASFSSTDSSTTGIEPVTSSPDTESLPDWLIDSLKSDEAPENTGDMTLTGDGTSIATPQSSEEIAETPKKPQKRGKKEAKTQQKESESGNSEEVSNSTPSSPTDDTIPSWLK